MSAGITIRPTSIRVTELRGDGLGEALVRTYRAAISVTPVIEIGKTHYDYHECGCVRATWREMDTFKHFEFELRDKRFFWRRDLDLRQMLLVPCAFEFWAVEEGKPHWIHWVFPKVVWRSESFGRYFGESRTGPEIVPEDIPDQQPLTEGGFFKTTMAPPR